MSWRLGDAAWFDMLGVYIFENTNNHYSVGIEYALDS